MNHSPLCPLCGSAKSEAIFSWKNVPANIAILWPTREAAISCSKGDLHILFCRSCGYIWNASFDSDRLEYSQAYDNTLHHSAVYAEYARKMAEHLVERYQIKNKQILEIGCGKGDFLILLCTLGDNHGVGFDTSYETRDLEPEVAERISIVQDFYSEKYADYNGDLIVSRYVFEHIEDPLQFLRMLRGNIGDNTATVAYFEVPDVYLILEQLSVWDYIYEHVSYFSPASLAYAFEANGFRVMDLKETYSGQFVAIEAAPDEGNASHAYDAQPDLTRLKRGVSKFLHRVKDREQKWHEMIGKIRSDRNKTIVWGAGAKGVSYLNMLDIRDDIPFIVDINPNKCGKYVPGTGQKIVAPEFLKEYRPQQVILMNPIYADEIRQKLSEMGINAVLLLV
jgi:SAM-dependent methyltransferase